MYLILSIIMAAYLVALFFVVWNDLRYAVAWFKTKTGLNGGYSSVEELEFAFDQPTEGSPAWQLMHENEGLRPQGTDMVYVGQNDINHVSSADAPYARTT